MTIRHLKIFYSVYQNNCSTTKAAEKLHMTQPAVSQAIKEIEQHYNVTLFDRISHRLVLTKAGERLAEYARTILFSFDDMEKELSSWDRHGVLRVGCTLTVGSYYFPRYIKLFKEKYPDFDIRVLCASAGQLEQKILDNEMDVAFSEGVPQSPMIEKKEYMDDYLVPFCSARGLFSYGQTITKEQFASQTFIMREKGSGTRKVIETVCENAGIYIQPSWESVSNTAIINTVASNLGVSVMSYRLIKKAVDEGRVVPFNVEGLCFDRKFYIINLKNKKFSSAEQYFLHLCNTTEFEI